MNLVTVTYHQVIKTHVSVDLDTNTVYGKTEVETEPREAVIVRDENGLRCRPSEAIQAIPITDSWFEKDGGAI